MMPRSSRKPLPCCWMRNKGDLPGKIIKDAAHSAITAVILLLNGKSLDLQDEEHLAIEERIWHVENNA